jgi:transposase
MTIKLNFTPEIIATLNEERHSHPNRIVRRRMEVLWFKSQGLPHQTIALYAKVSPNAMRDHFNLYAEGGIDALREVGQYRPQSKLMEHVTVIRDHLQQHPPATIKQAQHAIETLTGIRRSDTQIRAFLKKNSVSNRAKPR